jgi:protein subunit release factor B
MTDEQLEAECDLEFMRSGGPGGQHVNRTESAVRLHHRPTGITVRCQQERSQHQNRRLALELLRERLRRRFARRRKRVETRVPQKEKQRRLEGKKKRSQKKELRKPPPMG